MDTPSGPHSYWIATAPMTALPALPGDMDVDVAIVGGGIVGIAAARLLKDEGFAVAVLEARKVGQDKVTTQHGTRYQLAARR